MKTTTRLLSLLLALVMVFSMIPAAIAAPAAQQAVTPEVVEPDYFTSSDWIWSSASATRNSVSYFRNDYELKGTPESLDIRVSAHNHVKFYVNGNIVTGYVSPAPTALPENINYLSYSFEGTELDALLSGNQLALAAAVQYMGNGGMNYTAAQPGLWAEVTVTYTDETTDVLVTGSDWEALADTPYKGNTPNMSNRQMNAQIDYDAQKMPDPLAWTKYGYAAEGWTSAVPAHDLTKSYKLRQQTIPEGKIHDEITPVAVGRQQVGHQVFDVGRIATGWVKLTASAPAGTRICIRYSEDLQGDVVKHNVANEGSETYCDYYTFSGNGVETFIPDFDYKSFRYFEVVGLTELITVENVTMQWASTGVEYTADFESSDALLNKIYEACINTQINNLEGMPVDCPHREQSQYLADSQLQYYLLSYAFSDFATINYKTMLDFAAQQFESGRFTFVAPSQMYASGDSIPEWDLRYSNMLYNYYWVSGDVKGMSYFYDDAAENVNYYLERLDSTGLLPDINGWNISDHPEKQACGDDPGRAPTVVNILLYDSLNHLSKIATLLGKDEDAAIWASQAMTLRAAINANLLDHETGLYYKYYGTTATNEGITAMAINLGVAEPNMLDQQMDAIAVKGLASTSVVLTYEVFRAVMEHGTAAQKESVYERIIRTWGPMMNAGDSTCWEGFRDENSHSHAWNAYPARVMLEYMSGITYTGLNYTDLMVKPWLPEALNYVNGTFTVPGDRGSITSKLEREEDGSLSLSVENNSTEAITIAVPRIGGSTVIAEADSGIVFENGAGAGSEVVTRAINNDELTYVGNDAEYIYFTAAANERFSFTSKASDAATEGTFDVTINGNEGGKVLVNGETVTLPYTASFAAGTQVNVEAVANKNAAFIGWSGTYGSVNEAFSFTVGGNVALNATFEAREGTVYNTVVVDGPKDSGLKVSVNGAHYAIPARVALAEGQKVTVSIVETEDRTYNFVAWAGDVFSAKTALTFDGSTDVNLEVITSYVGSSVSNLALGKKATFNNPLVSAPLWTMENLTDGQTYGKNPGAIGATSGAYGSGDLSATPNVLTLDLEKESVFDVVKLYPRADEESKNGGVPCYPSTFTVAVSANGSTYTDVATVTDYVASRNQDGTVDPIMVSFGEQEARYIRITTTKVGNPDNHGASYYVQLHEMEVFLEGNLAKGKKASFNHQLVSAPLWTMENLTDGETYGKNPGPIGATSGSYPSGDLSANPNILTLDLEKDTKFNVVKLYPRADEVSADGGVPCYPSTFTVSVSSDNSKYTDVTTVTDYIAVRNPDGTVDPIIVDFAEQEARYIRITTTKANGADNHGTCYVQLHEMKVQYTGAADGGDAVLNIKGSGAVQINGELHNLPYTGGYEAGTDLAILAVAPEGTRFTGWSGDAGSSKRPMMYVTMGNNITLTANFTNTMVAKSENLALNAPVVVPDDKVDGKGSEQWSVAYLTDGIQTSTGATAVEGKKGFTSVNYASAALTDESLYVDIDLGADVDFNQITLWPRTDVFGAGGEPESPNFPAAFKVQYKLDGDSVWRDIKTFTDVANPNGSAGVFDLGLQNGRYIRIIPITLGSPAADDANGERPYRFQLAEIEVFADEVMTDNLGTNATITAYDSGSNAGAWSIANLVDGQVRSAGRGTDSGTKGYTSNGYGAVTEVGNDISSNPHWIEYAWDASIDVNQVILYPRSDLDGDTADSGLAANFPYDFHIDVKVGGGWKTVYSATGVNNGLSPVICDFETVNTTALRLITTKLGVCASDETSRTQRIQLAEMKVGNIIRGEFTEGSVDITLNGEDAATVTLSQLAQLQAAVEASSIGGDTLIWSVEDENGFVLDVTDLVATGDAPTVRPNAVGQAYVVARFANGLNTSDKLALTVVDSDPAEDAAAVDAMIEAIGEATADNGEAIAAARAAYNALSDAAKALVQNLALLEDIEADHAVLTNVVSVTVTGQEEVSIIDETMTFTVSVSNAAKLATATLDLAWNSETMGELKLEPINGWYLVFEVNRGDSVSIIIANNDGVTGDADILKVSCAPAGEVGEASLTVTGAEMCAFVGDGETFVEANLDNASFVTDVTFNPYDVNHDGIVDQLDLTRCQRWFGTADPTCDIDKDGSVGVSDMILVATNYTK